MSGPAGGPVEGDPSDRENARGKEACFQNAPGWGSDPSSE